jgi:phosphate/sulfate permease
MLVLASTAVTVIVIVVAVAVVGGLLLVLGPLRRGENLRDDVGADMGPLGTTQPLSGPTRDEVRREEGLTPDFDEEKLDERNE